MIDRASKQIAAISKQRSVILVHGAGSYGHMPVKKYRLTGGYRSPRQLEGLTLTKLKLLEWESILGKAFSKHKIHTVPFVASDFLLTRKGRIASADLGPLKTWIRVGCIPSVGGDIVPDIETGFSILSGDQIAAYLAMKMNASRLVFGTDVDGIFDSNPKLNRNAKLLTKLTPGMASVIARGKGSSSSHDVTGSMAGKISESVRVARAGIPVYFVNLTEHERLQNAALGQRVLGSRISI
jgi:isopentenyl phosphate kinase